MKVETHFLRLVFVQVVPRVADELYFIVREVGGENSTDGYWWKQGGDLMHKC